jgi:hypothetical protein
MKPPPRLLDDPQAASALRDDLQRVKAAQSNYDLAAGLVGLQSAIAAGSLAPPAAAASTAPSAAAAHGAGTAAQAAGATMSAGLLGALGAKLAAVVVGGVAVAAATVTAIHWNARPAEPLQARGAAAQPSGPGSTGVPSTVVRAPAVASATAEVAAPSATRPAEAVVPLQPVTGAVANTASQRPRFAADAPSDAVRREIAQLGLIKLALEQDPGKAYRLAQAGHRTFAKGVMTQEREALAILALFRLERRAEAQRRAQAFLERYPQSPLRERVQGALHAEGE